MSWPPGQKSMSEDEDPMMMIFVPFVPFEPFVKEWQASE
jgi:hypothetical protein